MVFLAVDEGCGVAVDIDAEVLEVEAVVGQVEVWSVLGLAQRGDVVFVDGLVAVGDLVQVEEIGDFALFVRSHGFARQRAQPVPADVIVVLAPVPELGWRPVGNGVFGEPGQELGGKPTVGREISQDPGDDRDQRLVVAGGG